MCLWFRDNSIIHNDPFSFLSTFQDLIDPTIFCSDPIFKVSVATLLLLISTVFVANADTGSDENAQTEQALKKQELDLKRARLRESLKQDQAHSLQRRALDKQKNQANIDRADYYNVLRNKSDSDSAQIETESEKLVNNGPKDSDERTKAFQQWVNSNMLLGSDSKISHKDAMKYEQKEELKKSLLESNSETVIMKKKSIGKIEKVNKE